MTTLLSGEYWVKISDGIAQPRYRKACTEDAYLVTIAAHAMGYATVGDGAKRPMKRTQN